MVRSFPLAVAHAGDLSNWTTDFTGPTVWAINKEQKLPVRFQFPPSMHCLSFRAEVDLVDGEVFSVGGGPCW
jgi:hypothetical protein